MTDRTVKEGVLPSKKVKGNVLSSLFVFFIDFIEHLGSFEHGAFNMWAVFNYKYTRQAVIYALGIMLRFLLLSFVLPSNIFTAHTGGFSFCGLNNTAKCLIAFIYSCNGLANSCCSKIISNKKPSLCTEAI